MKVPIYVGFSYSKYFVAPKGEPVRAWRKKLSGGVLLFTGILTSKSLD